MKFALSLFNHKRDNKPQRAERTWEEIREMLSHPVVRAEKDGPLFSPAVFDPPERKKAYVVQLSMLVIEYDHHASLPDDLRPWLALGIRFAVYTTHSHKRVTDSNPDAEERFRLVIPLCEPIPALLFPALWKWAAKISGGKIDVQAKDLSRMFYEPAKASPDAPYEFQFIEGELLSWREVIKAVEESTQTDAKTINDSETNSSYATWDDLNAELKRRIMRDATAKQNDEGFYHCRARCHVPKTDAGIMFNPANSAVKCLKGCSHAALLQSFGLPERPNSKNNSQSENPADGDVLSSLRSLSEGATMPDIEKALREFSFAVMPLDELARQVAREEAIRMLKEHNCSSPARLVDAAIPKVQPEREEMNRLALCDPELWPDPVDGAALLDEIVSNLHRFISATEQVLKAVALWIVHAHAFDAFDISPLLVITSPVKRCGKTTLLNLLSALVPRPLSTSNITASALFRTVEKYSPSLLIDEADSFLTDNEELRGILNSGHRKASAYVIRTTGDDHEPQMFTTWSPKIIAIIGALPDTLEDRAIIIRLQRKSASEKKERLRSDRMGEFEPICRRAARWASDLKETLRSADPDIPSEITNDRARDNWRPLLAIADAAGGDWPQFARDTARTMASEEPDSESARTLLLADLKMIFEDHIERLASDEIIRSLVEMESRPWAEWKGGKPLSKIGLAALLRPFGIKPRKWREGKGSERGYYQSDFDETFARYLSSNSPQSPHAQKSATYSETDSPQDTDPVATSNDSNSLKTNPVASVSSQNTPISNQGNETAAGNTASIAFMITKGVRQQLYDLGYSRSDVDQMKPENAQELIAAQKVKGDDREVMEI